MRHSGKSGRYTWKVKAEGRRNELWGLKGGRILDLQIRRGSETMAEYTEGTWTVDLADEDDWRVMDLAEELMDRFN